MIYSTLFDTESNISTAASVDSGFETIDAVVELVGDDYLYKCKRFVTYDGVCFSDFPFSIDSGVNKE